ncbi:thioredoxin [Candidatus Uhrbacteria bacterium]|nr:thioredoxin [Candidatus Uhrbacteria bacterium]MBD3284582.1 thioredoxin [Candidatus Uhrbacteria bacterium]
MEKIFTDDTFDAEVLKSEKPVLVDFWAPWCGPCRMMAPTIDKLAEEVGDAAVVGKLNVDENSQYAQQYGVMSIPTLLVFKGGQVVDQMVGVMELGELKERLMKHV